MMLSRSAAFSISSLLFAVSGGQKAAGRAPQGLSLGGLFICLCLQTTPHRPHAFAHRHRPVLLLSVGCCATIFLKGSGLLITNSEFKMLKRFADPSGKDTFLNDLPDIQKGRARHLCELGFLALFPPDHDNAFIVSTTASGRHELELYQEQRRRDRTTVILSIVAIVISLLAILAQLLELPLSELIRSALWLR